MVRLVMSDQYAEYIMDMMKDCFYKPDSNNMKFEVTDIDDDYFASVEVTGEIHKSDDGVEFNNVRLFGHEFQDLVNRMQDAGYHLNSVKQFQRVGSVPQLDVLFVTGE